MLANQKTHLLRFPLSPENQLSAQCTATGAEHVWTRTCHKHKVRLAFSLFAAPLSASTAVQATSPRTPSLSLSLVLVQSSPPLLILPSASHSCRSLGSTCSRHSAGVNRQFLPTRWPLCPSCYCSPSLPLSVFPPSLPFETIVSVCTNRD